MQAKVILNGAFCTLLQQTYPNGWVSHQGNLSTERFEQTSVTHLNLGTITENYFDTLIIATINLYLGKFFCWLNHIV